MQFSVADMNEGGDVAAQIQQRMEFDGGLGLAEVGPGEHRKTQVYGGGVERVHGFVELDAEILVAVQTAGHVNQRLSEVGINAPVADLVGVGQGVSGDLGSNPDMIELALLGTQARLDVAQAFAIGELGKDHAQILIPAGKVFHLVMAMIPIDAPPERMHRKVIDDLRENDLAKVHSPASSPRWPEHG